MRLSTSRATAYTREPTTGALATLRASQGGPGILSREKGKNMGMRAPPRARDTPRPMTVKFLFTGY